MAQNLPKLPDWEQISTNIVRILGGNPSKFTLQGTNTYLLGTGPRRILIDTGAGEKKWIDTLRTVLTSQSRPITVSTCLLTHWHHDHLGGVRDLEKLCRELNSPEEGGGAVKVYKNQPTWNPDGLIDPSRVHDILDGQIFSVPPSEDSASGRTTTEEAPFEIQAIHTPGHAKDHMVFQITSSPDPTEVGALFTADNVLGHGTAVFEDLHLYLQSLDVMKRRVADAVVTQQAQKGGTITSKRAFPGHGAVIDDAVAKIDEYIAHRRMREEEALNVLKHGTTTPPGGSEPLVHDSITRVGDDGDDEAAGASPANVAVGGGEIALGKEWESIEMVKVIYRHYPENLWQPAENGLLMVLEKLRRDGKVVRSKEGRWRVSEKATL
ncbi:uncharacterized protein Z519_10018 [Cladophialophora bantiana CBS 173.52]|uniref:Metallo-beta-lactamase domain-containing protein n=1 Tax=Cladophialophora bantiana (strain ATCC 10958 / CBS 173.52 / CDC B-1940 / NIH 8579) TaxID=1442370 RepID=A0A0D2EGI0_CLAB1|nr:uncharacterized protein Z519_10018 [Cladophialophora bantiana CBS 173.52]KIW89166.1 hypothetical protein Z519_10018 [Cladophialophora bantiana CBS 173.52]